MPREGAWRNLTANAPQVGARQPALENRRLCAVAAMSPRAVTGSLRGAIKECRMTGETDNDSREMRLQRVGVIASELTDRTGAPRQGNEGAPDAWLEIEPWAV